MKVLEIDDNVVYLQYRHKLLTQPTTHQYDGIDWLALSKQKMTLLNLSFNDVFTDTIKEHLDGVVSLIDSIQDDAEAKGYPVVWAHDADDWRNGILDIEEHESE